MALLGTFNKQPQEILDYDIDYSEFLPESDTIVDHVTSADEGLTVLSSATIDAGKGVKVWVGGGVTGNTYKVQVRAVSGDGRVKEAEFKVRVKEV